MNTVIGVTMAILTAFSIGPDGDRRKDDDRKHGARKKVEKQLQKKREEMKKRLHAKRKAEEKKKKGNEQKARGRKGDDRRKTDMPPAMERLVRAHRQLQARVQKLEGNMKRIMAHAKKMHAQKTGKQAKEKNCPREKAQKREREREREGFRGRRGGEKFQRGHGKPGEGMQRRFQGRGHGRERGEEQRKGGMRERIQKRMEESRGKSRERGDRGRRPEGRQESRRPGGWDTDRVIDMLVDRVGEERMGQILKKLQERLGKRPERSRRR